MKLNNKYLILVILILVIISINIYYFQENKEPLNTAEETETQEEIKEETLSQEFLEWMKPNEEKWDFNEPYLKCVVEKTCNGTFYLDISIIPEQNMSEVSNMLSNYGTVDREYQDSIRLEISNVYDVDKFINFAFIDEIKIQSFRTDYELNISDEELHYCEVDNECSRVRPGCCGCNYDAINNKYLDDWISLNEFSCQQKACAGSCFSWESAVNPKCIDNTCQFIYDPKWICGYSNFINVCKTIPLEEWNESNLVLVGDRSYTCTELFDICEIEY